MYRPDRHIFVNQSLISGYFPDFYVVYLIFEIPAAASSFSISFAGRYSLLSPVNGLFPGFHLPSLLEKLSDMISHFVN